MDYLGLGYSSLDEYFRLQSKAQTAGLPANLSKSDLESRLQALQDATPVEAPVAAPPPKETRPSGYTPPLLYAVDEPTTDLDVVDAQTKAYLELKERGLSHEEAQARVLSA